MFSLSVTLAHVFSLCCFFQLEQDAVASELVAEKDSAHARVRLSFILSWVLQGTMGCYGVLCATGHHGVLWSAMMYYEVIWGTMVGGSSFFQ